MESIKEFGKIIAVNDHFVRIEVQPAEQECHRCAMASLCFSGQENKKRIDLERKQLSFLPKVGQRVELQFNKVLEYSFLVYLLPLLFFLLGLFISSMILKLSNELLIFASAMLGLGVGFFVLRLVNNSVSKNGLKIELKLVGED
ncbi:MAG TPA: hypothetical protein ENL21_04845 [Caldithrix abyssi]|uniref:Fis family transcriptional regulator n=1 Tax=Caldithrix abyssi TaxID=187145 RepID=A0A7V5H3P4_CALAY|nr:SoxR reducing system RseC family protein [Caldisericaceae bacterium]HHE55087.1 hypothetical protein [Caldithrix abyssi]